MRFVGYILALSRLAFIAAPLAGCTLTLPVAGLMQAANETFVGRATGHVDAAGELELTMSSGAICSGRFVYAMPRQGSGTLKCSDGRSGRFDFVSTGQRGTGDGTLNGIPFAFTFG